MAILQKLACIVMVLNLDVMKLMQFNDLHLLYMCIGPFAMLIWENIWSYEQVNNVETLGHHICKTTCLIDMKLIEVM